MENLEVKKEHLGTFKMNSEEHGFNAIVIASLSRNEDIDNVGRLVQVRKKSGAFGSDIILIRKINGELMSWHNQSFFSVSDEFKDYYTDLFKDIKLDEENTEYSLSGKHKAKGFVVNGMDCTDGKNYETSILISKTRLD
jgi:hypothetical protein